MLYISQTGRFRILDFSDYKECQLIPNTTRELFTPRVFLFFFYFNFFLMKRSEEIYSSMLGKN